MNRGLIAKGIREVWPTTLLFGLALAGFEVVLVCVFPSFVTESAGAVLQIEFVRNILRGLLGSEIGDSIGPGMISSLAWVHPLVLALLWAHEITICSKMLAGEIDRGTIDVLLGLPVSRTQVYVCVTVVALGAGLCVVLIGLAGNLIGGWFATPELRSAPGRLAAIVANLYCLYIAVAGAALMISSVSDHRGRVPKPSLNGVPDSRGVLVKVLEVGVDGTDREINAGEYGAAPSGADYLILGHEGFGVVEDMAAHVTKLRPGDYVVAMVRKPGRRGSSPHGSPTILKAVHVESPMANLT